MPAPHDATRRAVDAVWRIEAAGIVAAVARMVRDVGLAEELAQDALVAALEHWPDDGVPDNPGAWLMTTAKRRAVDRLRQDVLHTRKNDELGADANARGDHLVPDIADAVAAAEGDPIGDDVLRLIFTACHPVLPADARIALTLKMIGGLSTEEIARAFLVPEPTVAQRIVRAKRTLSAARVPFELPPAAELADRVSSVLEVVYAIFNEGYTATRGGDWMRPALIGEALRLGRMLAELAPDDSEVHGLASLMELHASRAAARTDAEGRPVLLTEQDRGRWDRLLMRRGAVALQRAEAAARAARQSLGPYALQAAIAAVHSRAATAADTDWAAIVALYDALLQAMPSPVVALNRAVAVGMAFGPAAALEIVDQLEDEETLRGYQWLPSVRADLLEKLGRRDEARAQWQRAASWANNDCERKLLLQRAQALQS
jgi:RNA polymerase sigma factor (sigma-70 family)